MAQQTIVVFEDDAALLELVRHNLIRAGYRVLTHATGQNAIPALKQAVPDLVILDIMLPDTDGLEICRRMRADDSLANVPVILLTALDSETDRVVGLEMGANDYVVKPFSVRELLARIRIHLKAALPSSRVLRLGSLELDREAHAVSLDGKPVRLTATEFRLLEHLLAGQGRVCTRTQLVDAAWRDGADVSDRSVDVCVMRLRTKLGDDPNSPRFIRSVRGVGYGMLTTQAAVEEPATC